MKRLETIRTEAKIGEWHTISVHHHGNHVKVMFDGKQHFDLEDASIPNVGLIGMWSKSDAVTSFASPLIMAK